MGLHSLETDAEFSEARIRQAYLASGERSTTRVRIKNDADATVTIKSKRAELRRLEVEYPISTLDAEALLSLRHSGLIEKTRFNRPLARAYVGSGRVRGQQCRPRHRRDRVAP